MYAVCILYFVLKLFLFPAKYIIGDISYTYLLMHKEFSLTYLQKKLSPAQNMSIYWKQTITATQHKFLILLLFVFANGPVDLGSIPGRVILNTLTWYLIRLCLTLSNIRYVSSVKCKNPGKGVAPSFTPRCSSYWKGSFLVALHYYGLFVWL